MNSDNPFADHRSVEDRPAISARDASPDTEGDRAATGIAGLDDILGGGLPRNRLYLIQGHPGVGKTTLALQYLMEGRRRARSACTSPSPRAPKNWSASAASHGWSLDGIDIHEHTTATD